MTSKKKSETHEGTYVYNIPSGIKYKVPKGAKVLKCTVHYDGSHSITVSIEIPELKEYLVS